MATKVQSKTYFPGAMMDLNNGLCNGMWDSYQDNRVSVSERSPCYDPYFARQTINGYPKEQIKLTILKQESIFRQQLQELHRVHKRQRDLMNDITMKEHYNFTMLAEAPKPSHFLSQVSSQFSKEMHTQRRVIDLELPADLAKGNEEKQVTKNVHNLGTKRAYNLADLNEPIQVEEASVAPSFINKNCYQKQDVSANSNSNSNSGFWFLQAEPKKPLDHLSRKRTLFGVELCESSHTPSFDSSQSSPWDQNVSTFSHNRWIGSSDASRQIPDDFNGNKCANYSNSIFMTNALNSKISVSDFLKEPHDKNNVLDGKNEENLEKQPLSWLMNTKGKETTLYQMNMDSLQHHSQQFFKKVEKVHTDNCNGITKILGVPITDVPANPKDFVKENGKNNCISEMRHHIDLNLSFDEEEDPSSTPFIPEAVVKIASMEIDLEAPAALEEETDDVSVDANEEAVKDAAEAIVAISSSELLTFCETEEPSPADTVLRWFAEVIESGPNVKNDEEFVPEDMDYFEYMTLKLEEADKMYECYTPMILEEKEEDESLLKKGTRKGQGKRGRQRKDFQRDVLPGIISLSRREVTEDLQTFEEAFNGIGVSWQSKRKACNKNGRGRRRLLVPAPSSPTLPPEASPVAAVEQSVCREVALEKSLRGWGKRTRRMPRQRCENNSNHHSLALKC